ncbi:MAG: DMT family transporter, partial [Proteobacteria bacterium]|nr:DMT family transporter [Pseudomonadota bacterium]
MAALYICAKHLMYNMHPNQVAFMYKFSLLIVTIPLCAIGGLKKNLKTKKIGLHVTRGTFSFMATLSFFYGLQGVNVSDAAAITYLEPAIVLCMGILYFKERLTRAKLTLIICGFIGALFVIKPGF